VVSLSFSLRLLARAKLSQTKYSYRSEQTRAARCSHYFVSFVSHRHKVLERCPQRHTRVLTPHHLIVSTDKSKPPNHTDARPFHSSTSLFLCTTAQCSLCPQRHVRCTNRYKRLLRSIVIVSPATR